MTSYRLTKSFPLWFSKLLTRAQEDKPTRYSLWDPELGFWHDPTMTPATFEKHFDEMQERSDLHTHEITIPSSHKDEGRRIRIAFPTYVPHVKFTKVEDQKLADEDASLEEIQDYINNNVKFYHVGNPHELAGLAKRIYSDPSNLAGNSYFIDSEPTIREIDRSDPSNPVAGKRADLSPKKDPFPDSQLPSAVDELNLAQRGGANILMDELEGGLEGLKKAPWEIPATNPDDIPFTTAEWDPEVGLWHDPTMTKEDWLDHFMQTQGIPTHVAYIEPDEEGIYDLYNRHPLAFPAYIPHGSSSETKFYHVGDPHEYEKLSDRLYGKKVMFSKVIYPKNKVPWEAYKEGLKRVLPPKKDPSDKLLDSVFPKDFKLSKAFPIWVGKATDKYRKSRGYKPNLKNLSVDCECCGNMMCGCSECKAYNKPYRAMTRDEYSKWKPNPTYINREKGVLHDENFFYNRMRPETMNFSQYRVWHDAINPSLCDTCVRGHGTVRDTKFPAILPTVCRHRLDARPRKGFNATAKWERAAWCPQADNVENRPGNKGLNFKRGRSLKVGERMESGLRRMWDEKDPHAGFNWEGRWNGTGPSWDKKDPQYGSSRLAHDDSILGSRGGFNWEGLPSWSQPPTEESPETRS